MSKRTIQRADASQPTELVLIQYTKAFKFGQLARVTRKQADELIKYGKAKEASVS